MAQTQSLSTQSPSVNAPSQKETKQNTKHTLGRKQSRNEKRKQWIKQARPVANPSVNRSPEKQYISVCCSVPATKPRAGQKETARDPDSGKFMDTPKGLGKWRCSGCGEHCKVTVRKPKEEPDDKP